MRAVQMISNNSVILIQFSDAVKAIPQMSMIVGHAECRRPLDEPLAMEVSKMVNGFAEVKVTHSN